MPNAQIIVLSDHRPEPMRPKTIIPSITSDEGVSSREANIDDLFDISEPGSSFAATARARFASIATRLNAAKTSDPVERDEAVMSLQTELPRSFAMNGWSDTLGRDVYTMMY